MSESVGDSVRDVLVTSVVRHLSDLPQEEKLHPDDVFDVISNVAARTVSAEMAESIRVALADLEPEYHRRDNADGDTANDGVLNEDVGVVADALSTIVDYDSDAAVILAELILQKGGIRDIIDAYIECVEPDSRAGRVLARAICMLSSPVELKGMVLNINGEGNCIDDDRLYTLIDCLTESGDVEKMQAAAKAVHDLEAKSAEGLVSSGDSMLWSNSLRCGITAAQIAEKVLADVQAALSK